MIIALAQLRSGPDPQRNLGLLRQTVAEATRQGAQLVVAPEGTMANLAVDLVYGILDPRIRVSGGQ